MKKKIITMMLALTVIMSVTACGTKKEAADNQTISVEQNAGKAEGQKQKQEKETVRAEQKQEKETVKAGQTQEAETEAEDGIPYNTERREQVEIVSSVGRRVQVNVPEGYYWNLECEENKSGCFFDRKDSKETIFVEFRDRLLDVNEAYCDQELRIPYYATGTESEVKTEEIDGRTVYYKHISYEYEEHNGPVYYETVKAMCAVGDDHMLVVETSGLSGEKASFDEIREFFEIEEK